MNKEAIMPGCWWVEIPDANLRILCGTPMDIVKHLRRKGLIKKFEENGIAIETGPNAILLSDVSIQHGRFWNLAEFPVLHMLYCQGMAIPGHPGNTGAKPILIGLESKTKAILKYIHRGTYGLLNKAEMIEYGVLEEDLSDFWAVKLKFAYGSIKSPEELLNVFPLVDSKASLPGDVAVRRDDLNCYTFTYKNEELSVDLNLPEGEDWFPSYSLSRVDLEESYFSVIHIGEGNGWGPDKPCMGSLINYRGYKYLIDAGPGIDFSIEALGIDLAEIKGLFITHAHDDHFAGLTGLLRGERRISVYTTPPVMATIRLKFAALLEQDMDFLDNLVSANYLEEDVWNSIDGLEVRPTSSPHPLETVILFFRVPWKKGHKSYGHLADIVSTRVLDSFVSPDGISENFRDRVLSEYSRPVDIKKIDTGRGLIHGSAEDFVKDKSRKLLLSHTEGELSPSDREIGSMASFGQVDTLIHERKNQLRRIAAELLNACVPGISQKNLSLLLDGRLQELSPKTPILERNKIPGTLLLVISGVVDAVFSDLAPSIRFVSGALIGEAEYLAESPSPCTYRTRNRVRTLQIPADLYSYTLSQTRQLKTRMKLHRNRKILYSEKFPGHLVSCPRLDDLAASMREEMWDRGECIIPLEDELHCVKNGTVVESEDGIERIITSGGQLNSHSISPLIKRKRKVSWTCKTDVCNFILPGKLVRDIPILGWTLAEL